MRLDSVLMRAVGLFVLLGLVLFAHRPSPHVPPPPSSTPEPQPEPAVEVEDAPPVRAEKRSPTPYVVTPWIERTPVIPRPVPVPEPRFEELPLLPAKLTAGRRAALRAILAGDPYLLYFGAPPGTLTPPERDDAMITVIEDGFRGMVRTRGLRYESIGDSVDPHLAEFVHDFNLQMRHAERSKLIAVRRQRGPWSTIARLDPVADDLLFELLDDPTDSVATAYDPETGACEFDLTKRDGIRRGMRFVLWTQARPLRRVLALAEIDQVDDRGCRVRILRAFADTWPAATGIRASNPFFHRGRTVSGYVAAPNHDRIAATFKDWPHASIYGSLQFPDFCIVGDVAVAPPNRNPRSPERRTEREVLFRAQLDRAKNCGALLVPERLVRYLVPAR